MGGFKMKKIVFYFLLFFCFSSVICYAQSSNTQDHLLGTWINENDSSSTWIFNSDGIVDIDGVNIKYEVTENKIIMLITERNRTDSIIWDYIFSPDRRTLFLINYKTVDVEGLLFLEKNINVFYLIKKDI
jgi:hypothetical protein